MKRRILISSLEPGCEEFFLDCDSSLERVEFTPLEERIKAEDHVLAQGISRLKDKMTAGDFDKYINSLISLKKHEDTIFLITRNAGFKSVIEMMFMKQIKECFGVSGFRVVVMPF